MNVGGEWLNQVVWYMGFWHAILFEVMLGLIMLELFLVLVELREMNGK